MCCCVRWAFNLCLKIECVVHTHTVWIIICKDLDIEWFFYFCCRCCCCYCFDRFSHALHSIPKRTYYFSACFQFCCCQFVASWNCQTFAWNRVTKIGLFCIFFLLRLCLVTNVRIFNVRLLFGSTFITIRLNWFSFDILVFTFRVKTQTWCNLALFFGYFR